jgi:hypothetical protein
VDEHTAGREVSDDLACSLSPNPVRLRADTHLRMQLQPHEGPSQAKQQNTAPAAPHTLSLHAPMVRPMPVRKKGVERTVVFNSFIAVVSSILLIDSVLN